MDNDVSAGSATSTSVLGHLALGLTLLAFGIGHTGAIKGVTAGDAVTLALYVGGIALFVAGLLAYRAGELFSGSAFAALGAFWFTWGIGAGHQVTADAVGFFLILWALLALSLTLGAASSGPLVQGTYALFGVGLVLLAIGQFADSTGIIKVGGWFAVLAGLASWYAATAALANWPVALPGHRAAGRGVTATG
ncbi:acetate uptake transporter [Streptomyces sp. NPDC051569]|uniref:acetate uptake transporter n=1 Tax=Streptomyces sp. NPDC051569 TaxID=3365661 RepID=UPI0037AC2EDC